LILAIERKRTRVCSLPRTSQRGVPRSPAPWSFWHRASRQPRPLTPSRRKPSGAGIYRGRP